MKQSEIVLNHSANYNSLEDSFRHDFHSCNAYWYPFLYEYGLHRNNGIMQEVYYESRNNKLRLVINYDNEKKLPRRFRKTNDLTNLKDDKFINLNGLDDLNISGSAQFSENSLILAKQSIGNAMPIIIVDLRQESHGFLNGLSISWTDNHNKANKCLTKKEVIFDENTRLQSIVLNEPICISNRMLIPKRVENQKTLVKRYGMSSMRIPVTDKEIPDNDTVDYFIKFVNSLPQNTWLHFHCKAGIGRTTTFMVMYDIMKNAKNVSLQDIMDRQVLLGGKNLLRDEILLSRMERKAKRAKLIKLFYKYCVENNDDFETTWSQWIKKHRN